MKKITLILLCAILTMSICACSFGGNTDYTNNDKSNETNVSTNIDTHENTDTSTSTDISTNTDISTSTEVSTSINDSSDTNSSTNSDDSNVVEAKYTVTLVLNGGTIVNNKTTVEVIFGNAYDLGTPEKNDYEFLGWYNGDTLVETSGIWNFSESMTLTASWKYAWSPIV